MKARNWTTVTASGESSKLPAGAYIAEITAVEDIESREYLRITYDVAEGEYKGKFANEERDYVHQFTRSYKDSAEGMFKQFLDALELSSVGTAARFSTEAWQQQCNPQAFVGLKLGLLFRDEQYTNNQGEDRTRLDLVRCMDINDVRSGKYTVPPVRDNRTKDTQSTAAPYSESVAEDVPF